MTRTTDSTRSATASSWCYLLELPGELRNRIYGHVLIHNDPGREGDLERPCTVQLGPRPYQGHGNQVSPSSRDHTGWRHLKRQSLGLSQACRAIRHEFLPLHLSQVNVKFVIPEDLEQYVSDFFLRPEDAYGTCFFKRQQVVTYVEVLPLIQLLRKAPGLSLKFDDMEDGDRFNLSALVDIKGNQQWREYVEKCVTGIGYVTDYTLYGSHQGTSQLRVNIRHTVGEPWMVEDRKEDLGDKENSTRIKTLANKPESIKGWLEFAGIPYLDKKLDDVRIRVAEADEDSNDDTSATEDS